jgi:hypothetical protein
MSWWPFVSTINGIDVCTLTGTSNGHAEYSTIGTDDNGRISQSDIYPIEPIRHEDLVDGTYHRLAKLPTCLEAWMARYV